MKMDKLGTEDSPPKNSEEVHYPKYINPEHIKKTAKNLHQDTRIYTAYGLLDFCNLGPKLAETVCDAASGMKNSSLASAAFYDWLRTPQGIIEAAVGFIPLAFLSAFYSSYYGDKSVKGKFIYRSGQATRDSFKGLKNAIRGTKSTVRAASLVSGQHLNYLLMPLGLTFAALSVANRFWNRNMTNKRKDMMDHNNFLVEQLDTWGTFHRLTSFPQDTSDSADPLEQYRHSFCLIEDEANPEKNGLYYIGYHYETEKTTHTLIFSEKEKIDAFLTALHTDTKIKNKDRPTIQQWRTLLPNAADNHFRAFLTGTQLRIQKNEQSKALQVMSYCSSAYGGLIDGLYMFMGLVSIAALPMPILMTVAAISFIFSITSILTRLHEEHLYQKTLRITQIKAEVALHEKDVEAKLAALVALDHEPTSLSKKHALKEQVLIALDAFDTAQETLYQTNQLSIIDAIFIGLRQALAAHTAIVCSVFAVALISTVFFSTPLPAIVALLTAAIGVSLAIGLTIRSVYTTNIHTAEQNQKHTKKKTTTVEFIEKIKSKPIKDLFKDYPDIDTENETQNLRQLAFDVALPAYTFFSWTDIYRAFFSGVMKGIKLAFFGLEITDHTDAADNADLSIQHILVMSILFVPAMLILGFIWSGRQFAKYHKDLFLDPPKKEAASDKVKTSDTNDTSTKPHTDLPAPPVEPPPATTNRVKTSPSVTPNPVRRPPVTANSVTTGEIGFFSHHDTHVGLPSSCDSHPNLTGLNKSPSLPTTELRV